MSVSPKSSAMSQTGISAPIEAATWKIGRSGTPVTENGITDGAWLWQTAITSGRAS